MNVIIHESKSCAEHLLAGLRGKATADISDVMGRYQGDSGLMPYHRGGGLIGTAVTIQTTPGDNLAIHAALESIRPGDVLVVDGGGVLDRALVGDILKEIAQQGGAAGFVIYGAIRDVDAYRADDFPCYALGVCPRGPHKFGPGKINVDIAIGGTVVRPGDIVLGDSDGVVFIPQEQALEIAQKVVQHEAREAEIIRSIRAGTYTGAYRK